MPAEQEQPPQYTRYRTRRRLLGGGATEDQGRLPQAGRARRAGARLRRITPKRFALGVLAFVLSWLLLSLVLFLISSHFERTPLPSNVQSVLDPAGNPLTSVNNILVLGSDRRQ